MRRSRHIISRVRETFGTHRPLVMLMALLLLLEADNYTVTERSVRPGTPALPTAQTTAMSLDIYRPESARRAHTLYGHLAWRTFLS